MGKDVDNNTIANFSQENMKTKIVYVLVSSDADIYYEQALLSAWSARNNNPAAHIAVVMDDKTAKRLEGNNAELLQYIDERIVVDFDAEVSGRLRSRELKTSLRNLIQGDYLFIDADTIVCGSLEGVDAFKMQIGAALDGHRRYEKYFHHHLTQASKWLDCEVSDGMPYYNSGLMYVKDTPETHAFYDAWYELYNKMQREGHFFDQPSLFQICQSHPIVEEIDGSYNCQLFLGGLPYLGDAKVIHTFNDLGLSEYGNPRKGQQYDANAPTAFYLPASTNFLLKIKQQGCLTDENKQIALTAKRQFHGEYQLLFGKDLDFYHSALYHVFCRSRRAFKVLEFLGKLHLKCSW